MVNVQDFCCEFGISDKEKQFRAKLRKYYGHLAPEGRWECQLGSREYKTIWLRAANELMN